MFFFNTWSIKVNTILFTALHGDLGSPHWGTADVGSRCVTRQLILTQCFVTNLLLLITLLFLKHYMTAFVLEANVNLFKVLVKSIE